jgi:hypothetical protein
MPAFRRIKRFTIAFLREKILTVPGAVATALNYDDDCDTYRTGSGSDRTQYMMTTAIRTEPGAVATGLNYDDDCDTYRTGSGSDRTQL